MSQEDSRDRQGTELVEQEEHPGGPAPSLPRALVVLKVEPSPPLLVPSSRLEGGTQDRARMCGLVPASPLITRVVPRKTSEHPKPPSPQLQSGAAVSDEESQHSKSLRTLSFAKLWEFPTTPVSAVCPLGRRPKHGRGGEGTECTEVLGKTGTFWLLHTFLRWFAWAC